MKFGAALMVMWISLGHLAEAQSPISRNYIIHQGRFSIVDSVNSSGILQPDTLYLKPYTFYKGYAFFEFHRHHRCWFNCDVRVQQNQLVAMDRTGKWFLVTVMNDSIYKTSDMNWEPPISYSHLPGKWHLNKRKNLLFITLRQDSNYFDTGDRTLVLHYERTKKGLLVFFKKSDGT